VLRIRIRMSGTRISIQNPEHKCHIFYPELATALNDFRSPIRTKIQPVRLKTQRCFLLLQGKKLRTVSSQLCNRVLSFGRIWTNFGLKKRELLKWDCFGRYYQKRKLFL
jgi:hypothetical protein